MERIVRTLDMEICNAEKPPEEVTNTASAFVHRSYRAGFRKAESTEPTPA